MEVRALLPASNALLCEEVRCNGETIVVAVRSCSSESCCPDCGNLSHRVHSSYVRRLADLPWQGLTVQIRWRSRRFFCDTPSCSRRIFTERISNVAAPYGRKTSRLSLALRAVAFACGGEGGARLARRLGMFASAATMLRQIRHTTVAPPAAPALVVGVDDWALRRGQRYGTILVDLERHRPIDLLPERSAESFCNWLQTHPTVRVVSRDRGDCYIKGAISGAPSAIQVADRWHLLHNLYEALVRLIERYPRQLRALTLAESAEHLSSAEPHTKSDRPDGATRLTKAQVQSKHRRSERLKLYQHVIELQQQRVSLRAIARQSGLHRSTIRRWIRAGSFPEHVRVRRRQHMDSWRKYLECRWQEGCCNAAQLTRELRSQDFQGSECMVRRYVSGWRSRDQPRGSRPPANIYLSPKSLAWMLIKPLDELTAEQQKLRRVFCENCAPARQAATLAQQFVALVRDRREPELDAWLLDATGNGAPAELQRFAAGLKEDLAAVRAALTLSWSNGQTEGQVNRLKLVKRQMYARANFDLLRNWPRVPEQSDDPMYPHSP